MVNLFNSLFWWGVGSREKFKYLGYKEPKSKDFFFQF